MARHFNPDEIRLQDYLSEQEWLLLCARFARTLRKSNRKVPTHNVIRERLTKGRPVVFRTVLARHFSDEELQPIFERLPYVHQRALVVEAHDAIPVDNAVNDVRKFTRR